MYTLGSLAPNHQLDDHMASKTAEMQRSDLREANKRASSTSMGLPSSLVQRFPKNLAAVKPCFWQFESLAHAVWQRENMQNVYDVARKTFQVSLPRNEHSKRVGISANPVI